MAISDLPGMATVTWGPGLGSDPAVGLVAVARLAPEERYVDRGPIAAGGMGEVRRVYDRMLDCEVAMKTLSDRLVRDEAARRRFVHEGTITARLQHPGIVTVRDRGERDGRLWYTMTEVRGSTFRQRLDAENGPKDEVRLRQWLTQLQRASEAVAFAHDQGVIHRDLKPENLMFGQFGEVLVMDWGLAAHLEDGPMDPGVVVGTLPYMAPEQARGEGDAIGPWSDVYALGAMLHELLVGAPPVRGTAREILQVHALHAVQPLPDGEDGLPPELVALSRSALADDPDRRMAHAGLFTAALESWLVGAERRARALVALRGALDLGPRIDDLRSQARAHRAAAAAILDSLPSHAPANARTPGWEHEDRALEAERGAAMLLGDWSAAVGAALELAPDLAPAHALLADHHADALLAAEAAGRGLEAVAHEALLRRHDRGQHAALLAPIGPVTLVTDPPGAEVVAYRVVERGRRWIEEPFGPIGVTPLRDHPLPRGSWLLEVRHPERLPARVPVWVRRGQRWTGVAPGDTEPHPLRLPKPGEIADDEVYVPAGEFQAGGDPEAIDAFPATPVWLDGFVMRRFPVTLGEYLVFLNDVLSGAEPERQRELAPRDAEGVDSPSSGYRRDAEGHFRIAPGFAPDFPVSLVSWWAASAYAAWWADRTATPWRLPHELEWEKAARGVDGRSFPWGMATETAFANLFGSRVGPPGPCAVGAFGADVSVYGVGDLGGNVRDWCSNAFAKGTPPPRPDVLAPTDGPLRNVRGGSWSSAPRLGRSAIRYADPPERSLTVVGFRLVRSFG